MNINKKNDSLKIDLIASIEGVTGELHSLKTELVSTNEELERNKKLSQKFESQRDSLQQQLVNSKPDKSSDRNEAVREYERSKIDDAIAGYEDNDPLELQKGMRTLFNVEVEIFPCKKNELINLRYSVEMGLKFEVTPEDVFHHENRDREVTFIVNCPGVINKGNNQVLKRAKLTWERKNE